MSKRLTDSRKWDDEWFLNLSPEHKLLWIYLLDKCDHAGFFKPNLRLASFCVGAEIDEKSVLKAFENRVEVIEGKWFIRKYIDFQYGTLNPAVKCHQSVLSILDRFKGYQTVKQLLDKGCLTLMDMDKDKDKDKNILKEHIHKKDTPSKDRYGEFVLLTKEEHNKLASQLGQDNTNKLLDELNLYIGSKGVKYKSHYYTILQWAKRKDLKPAKKKDDKL